LWDPISGKGKSGFRINDGIGQRRKVSRQQTWIGNSCRPRNGLPDAKPPILRIQIRAVVNHSARIGAEEVIFERRNRSARRIEKVFRVKQIVAVEIMNVPVKGRV